VIPMRREASRDWAILIVALLLGAAAWVVGLVFSPWVFLTAMVETIVAISMVWRIAARPTRIHRESYGETTIGDRGDEP